MKWIPALWVLLLLSGCSPSPFDLEVSGPLERPLLEIRRNDGLIRGGSICLQQVHMVVAAPRVWARAVPDEQATWRLTNPDGGCTTLRRLTYGQPVQGLVTAAPPRPLSAGVRYQIWGEGAGGLRGSAVILFENGAWRLVPER
jgi:hypothetical protein